MTANRIAKLINLILLLFATAWFSRSPDWEPLLAMLALFATLITLEFQEPEERQDSPDHQLFQAFLELLPSDGDIEFIARWSLSQPFALDRLANLRRFAEKWGLPEYQFHDKKLEGRRKELLNLTRKFLESAAINTFRDPEPNPHDWYRIPDDWEITQPERYKQAKNELDNLADQVFEAHQDFIRTARRRLNM